MTDWTLPAAKADATAASGPLPNPAPRPASELEELKRIWALPRGWRLATAVNNTAIGWAFPGAVYPGRSVQDGAPVIVVDYSGTAVGFVRDELRADGRGGYRGRALNGTTELLRFHLTR